MTKLNGLNWTGGKGANSVPQGTWIASMLPQTTECCYVEPFAGMLGVLLQRKPSKTEIANDTDSLLINWWRVVRDEPRELVRRLELTPHSRLAYNDALKILATSEIEDKIEEARLWTIAISQSISKTMGKSGWSIQYSHTRGSSRRGANHQIGKWEKKIMALAERMKPVQLECRPAEEILERLVDNPHAVIYCDPPYPSATEFYGNTDLNVPLLTELLAAQKGKVAISGYGDEWNELGWERHECPGLSGGTPSATEGAVVRREILWTNYEAQRQERLL